MEEEIKLIKQPISKLILTLAIPAILGQVLDIAYNLIDGIFIGQWVGTDGLAGIGLALPITLINMAISIMLGVGTSTAIGRYIGERRREVCDKVLSLGLMLTVSINAILTIIIILLGKQILALMGASTTLSGYAMSYIGIVSIGFIFMGIAMLLSDVLRNEGIIKPSIIVMLIGLLGNIIFDVIFMYVFPLGMFGAGIATLLAQFLAALYILIYYRKNKKSTISFKKIEFKYAKEIFSVGSGVFFREIIEAIVLIILNSIILLVGGSIYLSAFSIINKIIMLVYMPIGGFAEGLQPIVSVNFGANKLDRVKGAIKISLLYSLIYVVIASVSAYLFGDNIINLFGASEELLSVTKQGLYTMLIGMIFIPITIMGVTLFQGVSKVKESIVLNLSRQLIFLLPMLLILPNIIGMKGVYYSYIIAELLSAVLAGVLIIGYFNKEAPRVQSSEIYPIKELGK